VTQQISRDAEQRTANTARAVGHALLAVARQVRQLPHTSPGAVRTSVADVDRRAHERFVIEFATQS
jgi:hypothetical protein